MSKLLEIMIGGSLLIFSSLIVIGSTLHIDNTTTPQNTGKAEKGEFPYHVAVVSLHQCHKKSGGFVLAGFLINKYFGAMHRYKIPFWQTLIIVAGDVNWTKKKAKARQVRRIAHFYDRNHSSLSEPAPFSIFRVDVPFIETKYVKFPIILLSGRPAVNTEITTAAWGHSFWGDGFTTPHLIRGKFKVKGENYCNRFTKKSYAFCVARGKENELSMFHAADGGAAIIDKQQRVIGMSLNLPRKYFYPTCISFGAFREYLSDCLNISLHNCFTVKRREPNSEYGSLLRLKEFKESAGTRAQYALGSILLLSSIIVVV